MFVAEVEEPLVGSGAWSRIVFILRVSLVCDCRHRVLTGYRPGRVAK